jgi:hypothetical protein
MIRVKQILTAVVTASMVTGFLTAAAAPTSAHAGARAAVPDPGFCGVRHNYYGVPPRIVYVVRNQCSQTWRFGVFLPGMNRLTTDGCKDVLPHYDKEFVDSWPDPNWRVVNC